ncbi:MAG: N-acetylneuraminate synthase family protein [Anaerolinea sp.]|nr:N-acetylneuraminate synthase family protein [Anaerolinea sp.]MCC6973436.1 N-acetylneuraminate synthase family protein [Anaerolineae bacterium]CAG1010590.1 N-acetylneuraminate synthase [Anaerolineae bacterium]
MRKEVIIGGHKLGDGHPVHIVAEIGINHNGSVENAKKLIDAAVHSGCDAVKFQKRTPELAVPPDQRDKMRQTPWGYISYMEYRYKVEFEQAEYTEIDHYCKEKGIIWYASCWDEPAVDFMEQFNPPCYKIASASLTDHNLLLHMKATGRPLVLSTGMSSMAQIHESVKLLGTDNLVLLHATSTYPCEPQELNLKMITTLRQTFDCPIGYSGHEVGLPTTVAAVALGACFVERHITLDRAMWGTDQAASVEPSGFERLVKYIRVVESSIGDGVKQVYDSEVPIMQKLRRK